MTLVHLFIAIPVIVRFCCLVALLPHRDLLLCAKHLFFAARTMRHGLQVIMRRADLALGGVTRERTKSVMSCTPLVSRQYAACSWPAGHQAGAPIMALTATGISRFSGCGMTSASVAAIKRHLK